MNLKLLTVPFPESDIEWRIGSCGKKGDKIWATCLAYISARAIMNRLDEVCEPENWTVHYRFTKPDPKSIPGIICVIGIQYKPNQWTHKEDGAEQTEIESFKGGISSALKRTGSAWGIGRYLYGLDQGFAKIVNDSSAYYGKTKEGTSFHWLPPSLPAWALPIQPAKSIDNSNSHPTHQSQQKKSEINFPSFSHLSPSPGIPSPHIEQVTQMAEKIFEVKRTPVEEMRRGEVLSLAKKNKWKTTHLAEYLEISYGKKLVDLSQGEYDHLLSTVETQTFDSALQQILKEEERKS